MKVLSVNIGKRKQLIWKSKIVETGIHKKPINTSIFLGEEDVVNDVVCDRKHHGGKDMAVFVYSKSHYAYFKELHPNMELNNGVFGENITVANLEETEIFIGDIFKVGEAIIQVSQPRFPCFKLGVIFGSQKIVKQYLNSTFCGFYFRVLQQGKVQKNNKFTLIEKAKNSMTVAEVYSLKSVNRKNKLLIQKALDLPLLADRCKNGLQKLMK